MPAPPAEPAVAVLVKGWPRLSESFIARELVALEARGLALLLVSLRHPTDRARHPDHERLRAPVLYLPEYLYQEPARVLRALVRAIGRPGFGRALRAWFRDLLRDVAPWPVVIVAVAAVGYFVSGWRLALGSAIGMFMLGWLGMWSQSMDTLSQVLVTTAITVVLALPVGILASQSDVVRRVLRPILDFLQTVPTFVFLVPVIMLFNVGRVPGIIASVLYAIPVGIRLTELGIRQVSPEAVEAARAFGSTRAQLIIKVQLPLARPAIALSVNQMIMMVLAMVVIAGMVGGAGLGLEAVIGLTRSETGIGISAGLCIVILAMILDRITQAWAVRQR